MIFKMVLVEQFKRVRKKLVGYYLSCRRLLWIKMMHNNDLRQTEIHYRERGLMLWLDQCFLTWGFCPQRTLVNVWKQFLSSQLGDGGRNRVILTSTG